MWESSGSGMWVAQQVLCFETPSPLHSLGPCPEQTPLPMAWAWTLTDLGGCILAVCGFRLGHVSRQQLGLWARTSSSVTAVAPCCHVGQSQTFPASRPALGHRELLSCLLSPPGPSHPSPHWPDSPLSPMHPSFIPTAVSPLVTPLGWMPVLETALGGGKPHSQALSSWPPWKTHGHLL